MRFRHRAPVPARGGGRPRPGPCGTARRRHPPSPAATRVPPPWRGTPASRRGRARDRVAARPTGAPSRAPPVRARRPRVQRIEPGARAVAPARDLVGTLQHLGGVGEFAERHVGIRQTRFGIAAPGRQRDPAFALRARRGRHACRALAQGVDAALLLQHPVQRARVGERLAVEFRVRPMREQPRQRLVENAVGHRRPSRTGEVDLAEAQRGRIVALQRPLLQPCTRSRERALRKRAELAMWPRVRRRGRGGAPRTGHGTARRLGGRLAAPCQWHGDDEDEGQRGQSERECPVHADSFR